MTPSCNQPDAAGASLRPFQTRSRVVTRGSSSESNGNANAAYPMTTATPPMVGAPSRPTLASEQPPAATTERSLFMTIFLWLKETLVTFRDRA
jgi:hypothetical protein